MQGQTWGAAKRPYLGLRRAVVEELDALDEFRLPADVDVVGSCGDACLQRAHSNGWA
jgi:hypothetical protein